MKLNTVKSLLNSGLIPTEKVKWTDKYCWLPTSAEDRKWNRSPTIYLLVGYCPNTLPYYMGLAKIVLNDLGRLVDLDEMKFGKVHTSVWCKGFTVLEVPIKWDKPTPPPGYRQLHRVDFYYD